MKIRQRSTIDLHSQYCSTNTGEGFSALLKALLVLWKYEACYMYILTCSTN